MDTGNTLKANGLEAQKPSVKLARLIVNRASMKTKFDLVQTLIQRLEEAVKPSVRWGDNMRELDATTANFAAELETLLAWDLSVDSEIDFQVANIVRRVKTKGDAELLALTHQFDRVDAAEVADLERQDELADACCVEQQCTTSPSNCIGSHTQIPRTSKTMVLC